MQSALNSHGLTKRQIRTGAAAAIFAHQPGAYAGAVATKFWTFRWEYYCAPCREYEWCGSKTPGYMTAWYIHNFSAWGKICSNRFFDVFLRQQFLS